MVRTVWQQEHSPDDNPIKKPPPQSVHEAIASACVLVPGLATIAAGIMMIRCYFKRDDDVFALCRISKTKVELLLQAASSLGAIANMSEAAMAPVLGAAYAARTRGFFLTKMSR